MTTRDVYLSYLQAKILEGDWHGVSDVANDLREMEAEERGAGSPAVDDIFSNNKLISKTLLNDLQRTLTDLLGWAGLRQRCWCPPEKLIDAPHRATCDSINRLVEALVRIGLDAPPLDPHI